MDESDSRSRPKSTASSAASPSDAAGDVDDDPDPDPASAADRLIIDISDQDGDWSEFGRLDVVIAEAGRAVSTARELDFEPALATVALSNDSRVRGLNAMYRHQDKPTNVLSFPAPKGAMSEIEGRAFLGDVVLAVETVAKEARELGLPPVHHLQHLVVHGLLHLLGFDHEDVGEAEEMEALETMLLARIGVADPYATADE